MSEADAERAGRDEVWIEKYRPQTLDEIAGQEGIVERLQSYVDRNDLSHMLFSGPAGIGKCVTGETPVLTSDGLTRIEEAVGDIDGFETADDSPEVLTLTGRSEFEYTSPSHRFSKETDETVKVKTRDGGEMTTTPEHKFLVVTHEGFEWKPAADLDDGDRIARPLRAPLPEADTELDWVAEMEADRTFVHLDESFANQHDIPIEADHVGQKKEIIRALRVEQTVEAAAESVDASRKRVQAVNRQMDGVDLDSGSQVCSVSHLRSLGVSGEEIERNVEAIQRVAPVNNARSPPIRPPSELSPDLAAFVGLAISEARLEDGRIKFYNTDEELLRRFESGAQSLFGVEPTRGTQNDVPYVEINNGTLVAYLESCFDLFAGALSDAEQGPISSKILRGDADSRRAFLRAVFDAEAHVTPQGIVELTQKDGDLITALSYLLSGFGVASRRKRVDKAPTNGTETEREYHTLFISGSEHLNRFQKEIGFSIDAKADRLARNTAKSGNPNHDTIPVQNDLDALCESLHLPKSELCTETLNPETPGRKNYESDIETVLEAATERIENTQQVLSELNELESKLATADKVQAQWEQTRQELEPIETRREIGSEIGVGTSRLLEYADGRRRPYANRIQELLDHLGVDDLPQVEELQETLQSHVDSLGVTYERLAGGTHMRGPEISNLLEADDHDVRSLSRFSTVASRLESVASEMCSVETLERLRALESIVESSLYLDEVAATERKQERVRVYDLTVPGSRNYVAGAIPTVVHNTTCAQAIARELYGDDWGDHFMELNASDERGIDVVRDRIKNFARTSFGGAEYRIIFLDEADALCVPPGTEVVTGYPSSPEVKPIEEVDADGEPIPSVDFETNEIQSDEGKLVDSGVADFFEVELDDGRTVLASLTHPFFVVGEDGKLVEKELQELSPGDEIADFRDDIGVSRCEICGDWTAGRFCSVDCKNEGHSREMQGQGNPMHGTEWSDERREKIVEKLSDGRFEGENNPNHGGEFHGVSVWEMDEEAIEQFRDTISRLRSGTPWDEWVVDADPEAVKERIGQSAAEWWADLDEDRKETLIRKATENCDYPVCDITGDNNPMRDPEVAQKVSEALQGHEPTGGNIRHSDELGHLVRSDWEYEVAKALQDAGVEYEYEPEFELSDSVFHPDFLLDDTVIEVKGVAELWGQTEKVKEFLETYGDDYTFVVVGDGELPHHEHYDRDEFEPALVTDGGLRTVQTTEVRDIEYSHRGKAYNISMEGTPNFMLANGILTHNTSDAQSALRRTMEQFSNNVRFILSCNYSSQIIDPIQSRCAVFRFSPLSDEAVEQQIRRIAEAEGIELTDDGVDALIYAADGDMRKAINGLQAASVTGEVVDEEGVYAITSTARPEEIIEMVEQALDGDFTAARSTLDRLLTEEGIAGGDVIDQLHRSVWEFDLGDEAAVRLLDRIGEADYRITEGANERIQLEALLASLAHEE